MKVELLEVFLTTCYYLFNYLELFTFCGGLIVWCVNPQRAPLLWMI